MSSAVYSPRGALAAAVLGFVVVLLDVSVVNVALEALRLEFATDVAGLQWVVNAYTLAFAALLLTSGSLGDRYGARRLYLCGLAIFTLASAACGLAGDLGMLAAARVFQGIGGALLVPNSLSMLQRAFPDKVQRSRALGWWGGIASLSLAAGPVVGGFLVEHWGWRAIFAINLPIGVLGAWLTTKYVAEDPPGHQRSLDWPGQGLAIVALTALTVALMEVGGLGWSSPWVLGGMAVCALAILGFVHVETRSRAPMLPLALFRAHAFTMASLSGVAVNFGYYGLIFVFSLFFQVEQGLSPAETGLAFLPMTMVLMAANVAASRLILRMGGRWLMVLGMSIAALGYLLLLTVRADGAYVWLAVPMLLAATGTALTVPTMTNITLSSADASRSGIASGVLNSARQIGGLLGVAVCGYLVRDTAPQAFMAGMHLCAALAAALLLAASVMWWRLAGAVQDATAPVCGSQGRR
ncbi:MFS transporter [Bordetella sp. N]|uniref:MFS transporter n=1 Tax=Bordetella sp. N TaxID=1746199 RepID=UPI00070CB8EF|nr:MFS transporter [Bordetella sp. N]ALM82377.1 MFS transporter [Bordetella sp. N]